MSGTDIRRVKEKQFTSIEAHIVMQVPIATIACTSDKNNQQIKAYKTNGTKFVLNVNYNKKATATK